MLALKAIYRRPEQKYFCKNASSGDQWLEIRMTDTLDGGARLREQITQADMVPITDWLLTHPGS